MTRTNVTIVAMIALRTECQNRCPKRLTDVHEIDLSIIRLQKVIHSPDATQSPGGEENVKPRGRVTVREVVRRVEHDEARLPLVSVPDVLTRRWVQIRDVIHVGKGNVLNHDQDVSDCDCNQNDDRRTEQLFPVHK